MLAGQLANRGLMMDPLYVAFNVVHVQGMCAKMYV